MHNARFLEWVVSHRARVGPVLSAANAELRGARAAARVGVAGFCWGGNRALGAACSGDFDLCVAFYPTFWWNPPPAGALPAGAPRLPVRCPVLGIFGAHDALIPTHRAEQLRAAVTDAPFPSEVRVYDAGHGFAHRPEVSRGARDEAMASDAMALFVEWTRRHLPAAGTPPRL